MFRVATRLSDTKQWLVAIKTTIPALYSTSLSLNTARWLRKVISSYAWLGFIHEASYTRIERLLTIFKC
jgi:hypothetical protein